MKPLELIEALEGQVVGETDLESDRRDRIHHVAHLCAGDAGLGNVDGVDGVEAVADEDAFTPVEHLVADSNGKRELTHVEIAADVGIQYLDGVPGILQGFPRQGRTPGVVGGHGVIVKIKCAAEEPQVARVELQFMRDFDVGRDEIALIVVEIAVVFVEGGRVAAVGDGDHGLVPPLSPNRRTDRDGGVEIPRDATLVVRQFCSDGSGGRDDGQYQ